MKNVDGAQSKLSLSASLLLAVGVGFFTVHVLSVLAPAIIADLGLSRTAYGVLPLALFVVAAATSVAAGRFVDAHPPKVVLRVLFACAALGWTGMVLAPSWLVLVAATGVAGISLALALPATTRMVRQRAPAHGQGTFLGIAHAGSQVGFFTAGVALPTLALKLTWRGALVVPIAVASFAVFLTRAPDGDPMHRRRSREAADLPSGERSVIRALALYSLLMNAAAVGAIAYVPLFAHEVMGLSLGGAGLVAAVSAATAIFGKLLWGAHAQRMASPSALLLALAVASLVCFAMIAGSTFLGRWLLWIGAGAYGLTAAAWSVVVMFGVSASVTSATTGAASGIVMRASFIGGGLGPLLAGTLADVAYPLMWLAMAALLVSAAAVAVLARPFRATSA